MKKSNYNLFIKQKGLMICFNSFTHTLLCVSNNVYEAFNILNESEFRNIYPKQHTAFIEGGFLISEDRNELDEIRLRHKIEAFTPSRNFNLMIFPTQDCNLKCWYCYETHVENSRMKEDIQENIIKFVEQKIKMNNLDSFHLSFFGGEPLLDFDKIAYPLSVKIKDICEKHNIKFTTFFVTNATLINEDNIYRIKSINPSFQITLDGYKPKHDKVRIQKNGISGSYDKIIKALHLISLNISDEYIKPNRLATIRINYDNNTLRNIDNLVEDLKSLDKSKFVIHFERVWQTVDNVDEEQKKLLLHSMRKFIKAGFDVNTGNFKKSNVSCPAEKLDFLIINYDGYIYKCNGRDLQKGKHEGILSPNGNVEWNSGALSKRLGKTTFENPMCLKCKILPLCMGPCSQKCIEKEWKDLHEVCSLKSLGLSLDEYLISYAENMLMKERLSN